MTNMEMFVNLALPKKGYNTFRPQTKRQIINRLKRHLRNASKMPHVDRDIIIDEIQQELDNIDSVYEQYLRGYSLHNNFTCYNLSV